MREYLHNHLRDLIAGSFLGVLSIICAISYSSLLFIDSLNQYSLLGISAGLLGSVILAIIVAILSSSKYTIAGPQDTFGVFGGIILVNIAIPLQNQFKGIDIIPTIVMALVLMTLLVGVSMYALGKLKLGKLVRYFPYPVMSGFLAGTGGLIFLGAIQMLTRVNLTTNSIPIFFSASYFYLWFLPVLYGFLLFICNRYIKHFLVLPLALLGGLLLFYGWMFFSNTSWEQAKQMGLLLEASSQEKLITIPSLTLLQNVHIEWSVILESIPQYLILTIICIIGLLFNSSGFELISKKDMDIDQELRANGAANMVAGLLGGMGGYQRVSFSKINYDLQAYSILSGIICGLMCALVYFFGTAILGVLPKFIFGAYLIYIALDLLKTWIVDVKKNTSWLNYCIIWIIAGLIISEALLVGVFVGVLLSLFLFFFKYSQVSIVKIMLRGSDMQSNVERNEELKKLLARHNDSILILVIHGYFFFGNAIELIKKLEHEISISDKAHVKYLVIDMREVNGIDISGLVHFVRFLKFCESEQIKVTLSSVPKNIQLGISRVVREENKNFHLHIFKNLDHAIEWCEEKIIESENALFLFDKNQLLKDIFLHVKDIDLLFHYFEKIKKEPGEIIYHEGEPSNNLYYLDEGNLAVIANYQKPNEKRLRKIKQATIVGEMGLYLSEPRSATVVALDTCILYCLTEEKFHQMRNEHPDLSSDFHECIVHLLAERLAETNKFSYQMR